jgi:Zn-finger nucleic acid-binding protein
MYRCPLCQQNLIKESLASGAHFWACDDHGFAIAVGILQKFLSKPALPVPSSDLDSSLDYLKCMCCHALMPQTRIFAENSSYDVAACFTCRFYWLDKATATIILPERVRKQNVAHRKETALAISAFENKSNAEEMHYQSKFTENLLQFFLFLPINAKKAFVKPFLKLVLWLYRLR